MATLAVLRDGGSLVTARLLVDGSLKPTGTRLTLEPALRGDGLRIVPGPAGAVYLYDGPRQSEFWNIDSPEKERPKQRPTTIRRCVVGRDGSLRETGRVTVPELIGSFVVDPLGRFVLAALKSQVVAIRVRPDGVFGGAILTAPIYLPTFYGAAGPREVFVGTPSPDGRWLASFVGDGFIDHAENYLQFFRVSPDGKLALLSPARASRVNGVQNSPARDDAGEIVFTPYSDVVLMRGMVTAISTWRVLPPDRSRGPRLRLISSVIQFGQTTFERVLAIDPTGTIAVTGHAATLTASATSPAATSAALENPTTTIRLHVWRVERSGRLRRIASIPVSVKYDWNLSTIAFAPSETPGVARFWWSDDLARAGFYEIRPDDSIRKLSDAKPPETLAWVKSSAIG